eukprot:898223-Pyramimonas_sp.AAC.1
MVHIQGVPQMSRTVSSAAVTARQAQVLGPPGLLGGPAEANWDCSGGPVEASRDCLGGCLCATRGLTDPSAAPS